MNKKLQSLMLAIVAMLMMPSVAKAEAGITFKFMNDETEVTELYSSVNVYFYQDAIEAFELYAYPNSYQQLSDAQVGQTYYYRTQMGHTGEVTITAEGNTIELQIRKVTVTAQDQDSNPLNGVSLDMYAHGKGVTCIGDVSTNSEGQCSFYVVPDANYAYSDKYLVEFLLRSDASTKFAPKNYWGTFPTFSLGWVMSEEPFFQNAKWLKWIDFLKVRASYGITGRDNIAPWQWQATYNLDPNKGSVFGAGYSASAGTVTIHDTDKTPPSANVYTGIIKPQSGGTSTTYYWTNETSVGGNTLSTSTPAALNVGGKNYFYTEVPLDNLGAISGNVTLTLNGSTSVGTLEGDILQEGTGNVFGGGDASTVTGNTTVILTGNAQIKGNVFGGGNNGNVSGNTTVKVE